MLQYIIAHAVNLHMCTILTQLRDVTCCVQLRVAQCNETGLARRAEVDNT